MRSMEEPQAYKELNPGQVAYYDGMIEVDLESRSNQ